MGEEYSEGWHPDDTCPLLACSTGTARASGNRCAILTSPTTASCQPSHCSTWPRELPACRMCRVRQGPCRCGCGHARTNERPRPAPVPPRRSFNAVLAPRSRHPAVLPCILTGGCHVRRGFQSCPRWEHMPGRRCVRWDRIHGAARMNRCGIA